MNSGLPILGAAAMMFMMGLWYVASPPATEVPPAPAPTPGANIAYVPYVYMDQVTGCQYLSTHTSTGLVARIAGDGKTHMGCKGSTP